MIGFISNPLMDSLVINKSKVVATACSLSPISRASSIEWTSMTFVEETDDQ